MLLRVALGKQLRDIRIEQNRSLREVSSTAQVAVGYLSEVERGQKEISSELLSAIALALGVNVSLIINNAASFMAWQELKERQAKADEIAA